MLRVHFLNVGHGDCTIIKHPSGRLTMIDVNNSQDFDAETFAEQLEEERWKQRNPLGSLLGGDVRGRGLGLGGSLLGGGVGLGVLSEYAAVADRAKRELTDPIEFLKNTYPTKKLWRFILTHPDLDHMRGLKALYENTGFDNFWDTNHTKTKPDFRSDVDRDDWNFYQWLRSADSPMRPRMYTRGDAYYAFGKEQNGMPGGDNNPWAIGWIVAMAASQNWRFKAKLRARAYGWRGSKLAISRLKEAASEIKSAAKADPVAAGDGVVSLMERIWPAFQDIDTSSGALGSAVSRTLNELIPILIAAPADRPTRAKWLERLFAAVQNDGVEYLAPAEDRWGEIAQYPDLINEYADRLKGAVHSAWSDHERFRHVVGASICLSCLLEAGRYAELQELLATRRMKFWSWDRFGAEALVRQGYWEAAIARAEAAHSQTNPSFHERSIDRFCEQLLIRNGRADEAYRRYGLRAAGGTTNLAVYRALARAYPDRDHRQMLLDLIESRGDKGKWFAAAKDAGFLEVALECATTHDADPSTLVRAARDFSEREPRFAASVAMHALGHLVRGGGYDPPLSDATEAVGYLFAAAQRIGATEWARQELAKLIQVPCSPGREPFRDAVRTGLSRYDAANASA